MEGGRKLFLRKEGCRLGPEVGVQLPRRGGGGCGSGGGCACLCTTTSSRYGRCGGGCRSRLPKKGGTRVRGKKGHATAIAENAQEKRSDGVLPKPEREWAKLLAMQRGRRSFCRRDL